MTKLTPEDVTHHIKVFNKTGKRWIIKPKNLRKLYQGGVRDFTGVNLSKVDLTGATLSKANLDNADLSWTNLTDANLFCANLTNANLFHATLPQTNLAYATLINANLFFAYLFTTNLHETDLTNITMDWDSRELIGERLRQAAEGDFHKIGLAGAIVQNPQYCWAWWIEHTPPDLKQWALETMRIWIKPGDDLPKEFKELLS